MVWGSLRSDSSVTAYLWTQEKLRRRVDGRTGIEGSIRGPRGPKNCSENPMNVRVGKDFALFKRSIDCVQMYMRNTWAVLEVSGYSIRFQSMLLTFPILRPSWSCSKQSWSDMAYLEIIWIFWPGCLAMCWYWCSQKGHLELPKFSSASLWFSFAFASCSPFCSFTQSSISATWWWWSCSRWARINLISTWVVFQGTARL